MFARILTRPAFGIVISIIILFLGTLGLKTLPIAQFPDIVPPTVMVSISYPGASANVLVESVLIPLEQSINGVQNMRFISSSSTRPAKRRSPSISSRAQIPTSTL